MREETWLKIRVYTTENYLDLELKATVNKEVLFQQLDAGNTIMAELLNGNDIILNTLNIVGIEIVNEMPPIQN